MSLLFSMRFNLINIDINFNKFYSLFLYKEDVFFFSGIIRCLFMIVILIFDETSFIDHFNNLNLNNKELNAKKYLLKKNNMSFEFFITLSFNETLLNYQEIKHEVKLMN